MDVYAAIKGRRSIRKYKNKAVPAATVMRILEAANWAPSGINEQQWEYYVVGGEYRDRLAEYYGRLTEAGMPAPEDRTERQVSFAEWAKTFGGAPLVIVLAIQEEENPGRRKMVLEGVSASFQNLLLAAYAEGLGTCWMTGPVRDNGADIKRMLGLPAELEVVAVTPLGYPDETPAAPDRADPSLERKVTWLGV